MTTYYVATRVNYVLVDAADKAQARELGQPGLATLYRECLGKDVPVTIHTIRPATADEIELMEWHNEMLAREVM